eukprot:scaffold1046_cov162-Ochromonas_danica.AAC.29
MACSKRNDSIEEVSGRDVSAAESAQFLVDGGAGAQQSLHHVLVALVAGVLQRGIALVVAQGEQAKFVVLAGHRGEQQVHEVLPAHARRYRQRALPRGVDCQERCAVRQKQRGNGIEAVPASEVQSGLAVLRRAVDVHCVMRLWAQEEEDTHYLHVSLPAGDMQRSEQEKHVDVDSSAPQQFAHLLHAARRLADLLDLLLHAAEGRQHSAPSYDSSFFLFTAISFSSSSKVRGIGSAADLNKTQSELAKIIQSAHQLLPTQRNNSRCLSDRLAVWLSGCWALYCFVR